MPLARAIAARSADSPTGREIGADQAGREATRGRRSALRLSKGTPHVQALRSWKAEGVGFEPTRDPKAPNGFRDFRLVFETAADLERCRASRVARGPPGLLHLARRSSDALNWQAVEGWVQTLRSERHSAEPGRVESLAMAPSSSIGCGKAAAIALPCLARCPRNLIAPRSGADHQ